MITTETPEWFDSSRVVWSGPDQADGYRQMAATTKDHYLLREVRASIYGRQASETTSLETAARIADRELPRLRDFGLQIPPVDWYVHTEKDSRTAKAQAHLIARVAIVDGISLADHRNSKEYEECQERARDYRSADRRGRLIGVVARQCMFGHFRKDPDGKPQYIYVDIEPNLM